MATNFRELAWGAFFYQLVTDYDRSYLRLLDQESLLARLRANPDTLSPDEFKDSVITFLNEWGGRHINKKNREVAQVFLRTLNELQSKFQSLSKHTLLTLSFDHQGQLVQDIFDGLRHMSWENRGPCRSVTVTLGRTFASKLAHVMNPSLFVMWDDGIAGRFLRHNMIQSFFDYVGFLKLMQEEAKSVTSDFEALVGSGDPALFLSEKFGYSIPKTLAKFLDEYNWLCSQRNLDTISPPAWLSSL